MILIALVMASLINDNPADEGWRSKKMCGVNSAFFFLRAHGVKVSYGEVKSNVIVTRSGSEFSQLAKFIDQHGLRVELGKLQPQELESSSEPILIHLLNQAQGATGHYAVVLGFDGQKFLIFDPAVASSGIRSIEPDKLYRIWSGLALARKKPVLSLDFVMMFVLIFVNLCLLLKILA